MIDRLIKILLIILFFLLPLINSHLFDFIGINWGFYVNGNYEFTKVTFFNIFSGLILILFFINSCLKSNKVIIPQIIIYIILILFLSSIFSNFPLTSFLGNNSKSHSFIMFFNLIGLTIIFLNTNIKTLKNILLASIISSLFVGIIGLKEYFLPSFDYGNLSNRAISTFGHPNYLALFYLINIPITNHLININKNFYLKLFFSVILLISIMTLFFTKSAWGIFLFFNYLIYYKFNEIKVSIRKIKILRKINTKLFFIGLYSSLLLIFSIIITKYYPEKLQSFISRFYIWETTIKIIFYDIKNILIGEGLGTLNYVFDSFKVKELYIFENFGFTADRPHNLFLYLFYNFGFFGLIFIAYLTIKIKKNYKNNVYYNSLLLYLLFTIFNFSSIVHYLIIILISCIILIKENYKKSINNNFNIKIIIFSFIFSGVFSIFFSYNYYINEYYLKNNKDYISKNFYIKKIKSEDFIDNLFKDGISDLGEKCKKLIKYSDSVENNFYCGNILWNYDKNKAKDYYNAGLKKLPDMWDKNSSYYENYFIKKLFIPARFYSEKFNNLTEILKRVGEK